MSEEQNKQDQTPETKNSNGNDSTMSTTFLIIGVTWLFLGLTIDNLRTAYLPIGFVFIIIALIYNPSFQWTSTKPKTDKKTTSETTIEEEPRN